MNKVVSYERQLKILPFTYICFPKVFSFNAVTVRAKLPINNKLNNEDLLQDSSTKNFSLNGELDFDSFGMGFCPNKASINQANSVKAFQLGQA